MNVTSILSELKSERTRIDQAIAAINSLNSTNHRSSGKAISTSAPKRRRGGMSVAARRKLSLLLKQRWAQGKMKPKALAEPAKASDSARRMSASARKRIAAAQRARRAAWRKKKAA